MGRAIHWKTKKGVAISPKERAAILAMRKQRPELSTFQIAEAFSRRVETINSVLRKAGVHVEPERPVATPTFAREASPITLIGFTDDRRIDWYRRNHGADRVRVAPPCTAPASIRAERANG